MKKYKTPKLTMCIMKNVFLLESTELTGNDLVWEDEGL